MFEELKRPYLGDGDERVRETGDDYQLVINVLSYLPDKNYLNREIRKQTACWFAKIPSKSNLIDFNELVSWKYGIQSSKYFDCAMKQREKKIARFLHDRYKFNGFNNKMDEFNHNCRIGNYDKVLYYLMDDDVDEYNNYNTPLYLLSKSPINEEKFKILINYFEMKEYDGDINLLAAIFLKIPSNDLYDIFSENSKIFTQICLDNLDSRNTMHLSEDKIHSLYEILLDKIEYEPLFDKIIRNYNFKFVPKKLYHYALKYVIKKEHILNCNIAQHILGQHIDINLVINELLESYRDVFLYYTSSFTSDKRISLPLKGIRKKQRSDNYIKKGKDKYLMYHNYITDYDKAKAFFKKCREYNNKIYYAYINSDMIKQIKQEFGLKTRKSIFS